MKETMFNVKTFLLLIFICVLCGFIYTLINNLWGILGILFVVLTAGFFFFAGGNFVNQGLFLKSIWILIFIAFIPIVFWIEHYYINSIEWYNGIPATVYLLMFTLGLIFRKIPLFNKSKKSLFSEEG